MAQFVVNPRRAPRAPARCRTVVVTPQAAFDSETEDIGSHGCQLVAPRHIRKGDVVHLTVTNAQVAETLRVSGRVAWVSPQAPWRVGVAFDEAGVREGARWFEKLVTAYPEMAGFRRVPERIAGDSMLYLGPPPRFLRDFSAEEAMLLRAIASGARMDELQARLQDDWPAAQRALFSLIARQAVTLSRGQAVHPDAWKQILTEVEESLAIEGLSRTKEPLMTPAPIPWSAPAPRSPVEPPLVPTVAVDDGPEVDASGWRAATDVEQPWGSTPVQNPGRMFELQDDGEPPLELAAPPRPRQSTPALDPAGLIGPDGTGATRHPGRARSADAQAAYDGARTEIAAGNVTGALAMLRRALRLSPDDAEIGEALAKLEFKARGR